LDFFIIAEINNKRYYKDVINNLKFMRKTISTGLLIILFTLPPILFWLNQDLQRFSNFTQTFRSLGQLTALIGISLFSLTLFLQTKLKLFDSLFNGLNRAYLSHHTIGAIAFILLLFHPLLLAIRYIPISVVTASNFLLPTLNQYSMWLGILSLLIMMLLIILTFFVSLRYNRWKLSHKFMAVAFILGFFHLITINSDVSVNPALRVNIILVGLIGFASLFYNQIYSHFSKKYEYLIKEIKLLNPSVCEIILEPISRRMSFAPGQFAYFKFYSNSISKEEHPFSMASSPNEKEIKVIIKNLGDYTSKLKNLKIGDEVRIHGPFGKFLQSNTQKQVWIAGGIGITPFLSKALCLSNEQIHLFYSAKDKAEAVYLEELGQVSNLHLIPWLANEKGWLTAQKIKEQIGELIDKEFFICGPPVMMKSLRSQLNEIGIKDNKIHTEEFSLL
jgi:predicted ferric reductase